MGSSAFVQSVGIIVREGFEVVLLVGAMLAVVRQSGFPQQARGLWWGGSLALLASFGTALLADRLFRNEAGVEVIEGVTLLVAAAVLFYVGHWLLAKADVTRWQAYLKDRIRRAARRESLLALGVLAFVAVYREGVETVLFYRALLVAEPGAGGAVALGLGVGSLLLGAACYGIYRFGVRIPLRPFFTVTSALLLLLAFVFTGKGLHELQEGGSLAETPIAFFFRLPALGVYPTLETLLGQALMLLAIAAPLLLQRARRSGARRWSADGTCVQPGSDASPPSSSAPLPSPPANPSAATSAVSGASRR
ncbi:MAG: FTR1 family protein [Gemmatimonadetes bacterium]|nr:FTR1 family protein [Gemmatimonadota bacterium]